MHNHKISKKIIGFLQRMVNEQYETNGLSDSLFNYQLKLNEFKARYNIVLDDEIVTDDGFLQ